MGSIWGFLERKYTHGGSVHLAHSNIVWIWNSVLLHEAQSQKPTPTVWVLNSQQVGTGNRGLASRGASCVHLVFRKGILLIGFYKFQIWKALNQKKKKPTKFEQKICINKVSPDLDLQQDTLRCLSLINVQQQLFLLPLHIHLSFHFSVIFS